MLPPSIVGEGRTPKAIGGAYTVVRAVSDQAPVRSPICLSLKSLEGAPRGRSSSSREVITLSFVPQKRKTSPIQGLLNPPPTLQASMSSMFLNLLPPVRLAKVTTPSDSLPNLLQRTTKFLSHSLAESTWMSYARSWEDFNQYCRRLCTPPTEMMAAVYLRERMLRQDRRGKGLALSTIYSEAKRLKAVSSRIEGPNWNCGILSAMMKILVKMGAKLPLHQAVPVSRNLIYASLQRIDIPPEISTLFYIAWKSAARIDDLQKMRAQDAVEMTKNGKDYIVLRWIPNSNLAGATGRQKNWGNGLGHSCVLDCGPYHQRVKALLHQRRRGPVCQYSTASIARWLKKLDPRLSGHSIKRGALEFLLQQEVPAHLIVEMARHSKGSQHPFPLATRTYLHSVSVAWAMGTQDATALL